MKFLFWYEISFWYYVNWKWTLLWIENHKSCSLEFVAYAYLIWPENHASGNALDWAVQFYHVYAVRNSFQNEIHSGIILTAPNLFLLVLVCLLEWTSMSGKPCVKIHSSCFGTFLYKTAVQLIRGRWYWCCKTCLLFQEFLMKIIFTKWNRWNNYCQYVHCIVGNSAICKFQVYLQCFSIARIWGILQIAREYFYSWHTV